jgi:hypothetical protein
VTSGTNLVSRTKINEIIVMGGGGVNGKGHPMSQKAQRGRRSTALLILELGTRWEVWIVDTTAGLGMYGEEKIFYTHQDLSPSTIQLQRVAVLTTLSWSPVIGWCFVNISGYYLRNVT